ncbi:MAG: hypothetical protein ACOC4Y_02190 [bacterium]
MKVQLHFLKLVYPPISNQEAEWVKNIPEVQEVISRSNLYMIGQRHESKFIIDEHSVIPDFVNEFSANFTYSIGDDSTEVTIDFLTILELREINLDETDLEFEFGEKLIRIWSCKRGSEEKIAVIDWFTTEKILFDAWRGHPAIKGFSNLRKFTRYYLHYVGMSKKEDSLSRLVIKPHDKRLRILSNESSYTYSSRITDEIILFFFRVEPWSIHILNSDTDITECRKNATIEHNKIIADAEKAFVYVLDSKYNAVKYLHYPKGKDGLYNSGLKRYSYTIAEDITFLTESESIAGCFAPQGYIADKSDLIQIEGDDVFFYKLIDRAAPKNSWVRLF